MVNQWSKFDQRCPGRHQPLAALKIDRGQGQPGCKCRMHVNISSVSDVDVDSRMRTKHGRVIHPAAGSEVHRARCATLWKIWYVQVNFHNFISL